MSTSVEQWFGVTDSKGAFKDQRKMVLEKLSFIENQLQLEDTYLKSKVMVTPIQFI